jgi:hypothetical protein
MEIAMSGKSERVSVSGRDPCEVLPVAEACKVLNISRRTLYRAAGLPRVQLSAGRVGIRVGDVLDHARRGFDRAPAPDGRTNVWVDDFGGALLAEWFLGLPAWINTVVRLKPAASGASLAFSLELPPARSWWAAGHKELLLHDAAGLNVLEPAVLLAHEGEELKRSGERRSRQRIMLTQPHAIVRLTPIFGWPEKMADGWLVG